jgi:cell division protein FtsN
MAKPAPSHNTGRSGGGSIFTGVLIGLIVGAILAVGVALWITGSNPFQLDAPAATPSETAPAAPEAAPSFDFYKVLPSDTPTELPTAAEPTAPATRYYLQAGAFQNPADADDLKAQLALLGIEAAIQTTEIGDQGVFHRVRVGPLYAMDEVERTRSLLAQNNIPATLVKEVPTP